MLDPPFLLPSEIARLVYGKLEDFNCPEVAEKFLTTSPDMAECLENVKKKGKADFMTKAFSLSLEEILESYLNISSAILDEMNKAMPDRSQKFCDPIAALKTLLSLGEQSPNKTDQGDGFMDKTSTHNISGNVSTIDLQIGISPEKLAENRDEQSDLNNVCDTNSANTENLDDDNGCELASSSVQKPNSRTRLLDELYASTEDLECGPKKRIKYLKPRQTYIDKSAKLQPVGKSLGNDDAKNSENIYSNENNKSEMINVDDKSDDSIFLSPQITPSTSSMRLRSCKQVENEAPAATETVSKPTKSHRKSKSSHSSESEKEKRNTNLNSAKECDALVDFTQIPRMFMDNPKWPELIAENINKGISESPRKRIETSAEEQNSVFESIAERTLESDDLCEEIIRGLYECCTENTTQLSPSLDDDITFPNLCEANQSENDVLMNQLSNNQHLTNPTQFDGNYNEEINAKLHDTRLQEDMSEFINFNKQQSNESQSDVIVIEMPQNEQNTPASGDYIVKSHTRMLQSNNIMYVDNENEFQDEIINLCPDESKNVEWSVQSSAVVTTTTSTVPFVVGTNNQKNKFQICGPIIPLGQTYTRNNNGYRAIAPKPVPEESVSEMENETTDNQPSANVPSKTRSRSSSNKVSRRKITTRRSKR